MRLFGARLMAQPDQLRAPRTAKQQFWLGRQGKQILAVQAVPPSF